MDKKELDKCVLSLLFPRVDRSVLLQSLENDNISVLDFIKMDYVQDVGSEQIEAVEKLYNLLEESGQEPALETGTVPFVPMITVESSNIEAVGWSGGVMFIRFKGNTIYRYDDVTEAEFKKVLKGGDTGSVGRALQEFKELNKPYKKLV